jgi:hypothetical protein
MRRIPLVLAAGVVALVPVALLATSGSAQSPAPTTLHLIEKDQKTVGFGPNHRPRQGDRFGFGSTVTGDDAGHNRGICTVIGTQGLCTVQETLSKGTLTAQGLVRLQGKAKNVPFTITGGTGAYNGASGIALVTDVTSSTTDIRITFAP